MAIVDSETILSHRQVVTETTYAQRYIDMQALADYGVGQPIYFVFNILGTFAKDLRVVVFGSKTDDLTDLVELANSGIHKKASLVAGSSFVVTLNQTDVKYKNIVVMYVPSTDGTETLTPSGANDAVDVSNFAPPTKAGHEEAILANGITAYAALTVPTKLYYPVKNQDKITE